MILAVYQLFQLFHKIYNHANKQMIKGIYLHWTLAENSLWLSYQKYFIQHFSSSIWRKDDIFLLNDLVRCYISNLTLNHSQKLLMKLYSHFICVDNKYYRYIFKRFVSWYVMHENLLSIFLNHCTVLILIITQFENNSVAILLFWTITK